VFLHPCTMLVSGPTGCGKTALVSEFVKRKLFEPIIERVIWMYSEWQPIYENLQKIGQIEFIKNTNENTALDTIYGNISPRKTNLLILNDQLQCPEITTN